MEVHHNRDVEELLKDRYSIVDRVSHSRQADVYVARGESDRAPYVVKVSPIPNEAAYSEVVGFAEELKKLCPTYLLPTSFGMKIRMLPVSL